MRQATFLKKRNDSVVSKYIPLLVLLAILTLRAVAGQAIPLEASDAQVTDQGNLQYSLTSSARQPATAWCVTILVADRNGTVVRQAAITLDEYRAEAQRDVVSDDEIGRSLLRPQRTRRFELPGPFDPRLLVTVTPVAMVFLDGTSVGDPLLLESIFHRRAAERDARGEMLRQLRDVQTHYVGPAALREAIARLSKLATPDPGRARQLCQKNLREALARSEANDIDPMAELSRQIEFVRREYEAAVQHATTRNQD
jgi:hypothetical protein